MIFATSVPEKDRKRISKALDDIEDFGDSFHKRLARFVLSSEMVVQIAPASEVGGSGSVCLDDQWGARRAVGTGELSMFDAAAYVRLNIARETIDTGGQRGIEGTCVHEGKHALDFARMLSSFSRSTNPDKLYNPTAFQRELSAHITSAFYLRLRGGEYAAEGISLGLLEVREGELAVSAKGIRRRLANNYGLTPENPGRLLNTASFPKIKPPRRKWFGIF